MHNLLITQLDYCCLTEEYVSFHQTDITIPFYILLELFFKKIREKSGNYRNNQSPSSV